MIKPTYVLGIDTSCDDTCVSVLEFRKEKPDSGGVRFKIISNEISSQVKLHARYGGVYPMLAKREHIKNLPLVFRAATKNINTSKLDFISVTHGPGLEPCLWQGVNFAENLSRKFKKPLLFVNHIEAHIFANWLQANEIRLKDNIFPAMCLIVSGGHTQLILMKKFSSYEIIGETRDDAAGECFDKTARILGLGYPGGPLIGQLASKRSTSTSVKIDLPRPMIAQKNYDFSFSGLKTAVLYDVKKRSSGEVRTKSYLEAMSFEIQQSIIDVLLKKTLKAAKDFRVNSVIVGGGVAANKELGDQFKSKMTKEMPARKLFIPNPRFCTDNGAMIALAAYFGKRKKVSTIKADANLRI